MDKNRILMILVVALMAISIASPLLFYVNYVSYPEVKSAGGGAVASVSVFVPAECGDTLCELDETCSSCPSDCGECVYECGNGICDTNETCSTCPADCGTCGDTGSGGGSGSGGGGSGFTPALRVNFAFSPGVIQEQFFPGGSLTKIINATNLGIEQIELDLSVVNLEGLVFLDKDTLYLKYGETEQFEALISIPEDIESEVFLGDIVGKAQGLEKSLPLVLRVMEEDSPFRLDINISESSKVVRPGQEVEAQLFVYSTLKANNTLIDHSIRSRDEEILLQSFDIVNLSVGENSFVRKFRLPYNIPPDYYLYYVNLTYGGKDYLDAVTFRVESPEEVPGFLDVNYIAYASIILILALLFGLEYILKKKLKFGKKPISKTKKKEKVSRTKDQLVQSTIIKITKLRNKANKEYDHNLVDKFFKTFKSFLTKYYSINHNLTFDEIKNQLNKKDINMKSKVIGFIDKIAHLPYTYSSISKKDYIKILDEAISLLKSYKK